jgi:flavin reductase (DIM6/NTAB) family NADH-FMN oxidoreductase RutF
MAKKELGVYNYFYPMPVFLVGSIVNGKINYAMFAGCGTISMKPWSLYITSNKRHYTNIGIRKSKAFSINVPSVDIVKKADYCGRVSGAKEDKSNIFKTFYGKTDAPMIEECPVNMECKLIKEFELNDNEVFIGEIVNCYINEEYLENGYPNIKKINPLIYDMTILYKNWNWPMNGYNIDKNN